MTIARSQPLSLIPTSSERSSDGVISGAFYPGGSAREWLREAAAWGDRGRSARFCILSGENGVLILPGPGKESWKASPRAIACQQPHENLWIPAGTSLSPAPLTEEIPNLFPYSVQFFHPRLGLIGWEDDQCLSAASLILRPRGSGVSWEMAEPGPRTPPSLSRITLKIPEGLPDDILDSLAGDIGSLPVQSLKTSGPGLGIRIKAGLARWTFSIVRLLTGIALFLCLVSLFHLTSTGRLSPLILVAVGALIAYLINSARKGHLPGFRPKREAGTKPGQATHGSATGPSGFLNYLREWARRQTQALENARMNEIERLMKLLKENPEQGLRYALPVAGEEETRGYAATPSTRLSLRNPVLGKNGGGSLPADHWDLNQETRWKLHQQYRVLAEAESKAGRHDRAAYIYGSLLGMWGPAAKELSAAGKPIEAARICRTKLNQPVEAAGYLEKGGLLAEAALIFAEHRHHEKAGDLWNRLGQRDDAFREWLAAVKASGFRWQAAPIIEKKMGEPGWAASVLASGWPDTEEATECLKEHFQLLARCQADEESLLQVHRLERQRHEFLSPRALGKALGHLQKAPLQPTVKRKLASIGRRIVAEQVAGLESSAKQRKWLNLLPEYDADDPLLKRDVRRQGSRKLPAARLPLRTPLQDAIKPERTHLVGLVGNVLDFCGDGEEWFLLEVDRQSRRLTLCMEHGSTDWGISAALHGWVIPFSQLGETRIALNTGHLSGDRASRDPSKAQAWKHRPWSDRDGLLGICRETNDRILTLTTGTDGLIDLGIHCRNGELIRTHALGWANTPESPVRLPMAATQTSLVFALDNCLYELPKLNSREEPKMSACNLPEPVDNVAINGQNEERIVAATWKGEAILLYPAKRWETIQIESSPDNSALKISFLADGNLAVVNTTGGRLYDPQNPQRPLARFDLPEKESEVVAIAPQGNSSLAVLHRGGDSNFRVSCFRFEA